MRVLSSFITFQLLVTYKRVLKFMAEALIMFLKNFTLVMDFLLLQFYRNDKCDVGSHKIT